MPDKQDNQVNQRQANLDAAIHSLHEVFSRYELRPDVEGCSHCTSSFDNDLLHSRPLYLLGAGDLQRLARKAMTTLGTLGDFKHFLPRILEIMAREGMVGETELEIVLDKLRYAGWTDWPDEERAAIQRYLMALWQNVLACFPTSPSADSWLCGLGQALDDVSAYLDAWLQDESPTAAQHLAEFIEWNLERLTRKHRLWSAWWESREEPMRQVIVWLLNPIVCNYLKEAFFRYSTEPFAGDLSRAEQRLEWLQERAQNMWR